MGWWKNWRRQRERKRIRETATGREVDFRQRGWGHNIEQAGTRNACWSTPRLENGDTIITELGRFIVYDARGASVYGPDDMVTFLCIRERD